MSTLEQTRKARPAEEWASERLFRPLAQSLVDPAARLGVRPTRLVLLHTGLGLLAAWQLRHGRGFLAGQLSPALLLQLKTVLDNLDGQLARATGQTTQTGRYLDSEMDVVVNAGLLWAILGRAGLPATLLLSLILTVDFLWERDHRAARGQTFRSPPAQQDDHPLVLAALERAYALYFQPQERVLDRLFEWRLRRRLGRAPTPHDRVRYTPLAITAIAANLGLSSQLLLLGLCVLAGRPRLYAASVPLQALLLAAVQLWREGQLQAGEAVQLAAAPA
ncbi:CDP-alcohol phosphatidyltransferase family protein [Deinococcus sonorensis]|uniref:CDP-alcohol phosphatidyltransferase family protein n=2 Tax=Deinococcus sonorensis TaxID=309891 RepID=A0AAU7UDJ0_9DEIO